MKQLTPGETEQIIKDHVSGSVSMCDIAVKYGRTRQGIWKLLKRNGVLPDGNGRKKSLTPEETKDIVEAYTVGMVSAIDLAKKYNRTRQGIWKLLKRSGVNPADYTHIKLKCFYCDADIERTRAQVRNAGKLAHKKRNFCDLSHYYLYINEQQDGEYIENRQGTRVARRVMREYYISNNTPPPYGTIVHHVDRDCHNNNIENLMTFKDQADHLRFHRGMDVKPVFDGSRLR